MVSVQNADLQHVIDDKDAQLSKWYHNPFVMSAFGIALGALAVSLKK